jgi:hypothetical protein
MHGLRALIYGMPGVGKTYLCGIIASRFAGKSKSIVYADLEDGLIAVPNGVRVIREDGLPKLEDTSLLILDSLDALLLNIRMQVAAARGVETIADIPYGRGNATVRDKAMAVILRLFSKARIVIMTSHARYDDPTGKFVPTLGYSSDVPAVAMDIVAQCGLVAYMPERGVVTTDTTDAVAKSRYSELLGQMTIKEFAERLESVVAKYVTRKTAQPTPTVQQATRTAPQAQPPRVTQKGEPPKEAHQDAAQPVGPETPEQAEQGMDAVMRALSEVPPPVSSDDALFDDIVTE